MTPGLGEGVSGREGYPQSLRVMYRESQHDLALIRFPTFLGLAIGFRVRG